MQTAVVLFVYNRPRHTARTVKALEKNLGATDVDLWVFSDGPRTEKDVQRTQYVRSLVQSCNGFRSVNLVERDKNFGLSASIRAGVAEVLQQVDAVTVLEDDLLTSPFFLKYMHNALDTYAEDERVLSVSAFMPPRILMPRAAGGEDVWLSLRNLSYGWGVWKDRWDSVDWEQVEGESSIEKTSEAMNAFAKGGADLPVMMDKQLRGETDSWAIFFSYAHFCQGRYSILPRNSYVKPIGLDGSGVHCRPSPLGILSTTRYAVSEPVFPEHLEVDEDMQRRFRKYYDWQYRMAKRFGRV